MSKIKDVVLMSLNELDKIYKDSLLTASSENQNRLIFNDRPMKANIFMSILLEKAKHEVNICSHNLNSEVTKLNGFEEALDKVLQNKKIKVRILVNEATDNKNIQKLLDKYINKDYGNELRFLNDNEILSKVFEGEKHFTTIDGLSYRMEHDTDGYQAKGNFNDPEMSTILNSLFDKLFTNNYSK